MPRRTARIVAAAVFICFGCSQQDPRAVILATTTSIRDVGLLDELAPMFEARSGLRVKAVGVGSGHAVALGKRGEADVLLVHSPEAEEAFMKAGFGIERRFLMRNDYVIIGPCDDPARIRGLASAAAFRRIAESQSVFVSRGDDSGTYLKEREIWLSAGINPDGSRWYQQTGLGMAETLSVAHEKGGYTLSDRATFVTLRSFIKMAILVSGEASFANPYHVILVNPNRFPSVNAAGGRALYDFLISDAVRERLRQFGVDKFGQPLFIPASDK